MPHQITQLGLSVAHRRVQPGSSSTHIVPHGTPTAAHSSSAVPLEPDQNIGTGKQAVQQRKLQPGVGLADKLGFTPFIFPALLGVAAACVFKVCMEVTQKRSSAS